MTSRGIASAAAQTMAFWSKRRARVSAADLVESEHEQARFTRPFTGRIDALATEPPQAEASTCVLEARHRSLVDVEWSGSAVRVPRRQKRRERHAERVVAGATQWRGCLDAQDERMAPHARGIRCAGRPR